MSTISPWASGDGLQRSMPCLTTSNGPASRVLLAPLASTPLGARS